MKPKRGYTCHEMIPEFTLINMNGRIYDPQLCRFLAPDRFVQAPGNSQSFNRYSYCLNNPLRYVDPSGHKFKWSYLIPVYGMMQVAYDNPESVATVVSVGADIIMATNPLMLTMSLFKDDFYENAFRISDGLTKGTNDQIRSRFTNELPQTLLGWTVAQALNIVSPVNNVDNGYGVTVIDCEYFDGRGAMTIGSYMFGPTGFKADYHDHLFVHEFGHTTQSRDFGWWYLPIIGIPSITSGKWDDNNGNNLHDFRWFETDASSRGADFFDDYSDFDRNSFITGARSSYINPRTGFANTRPSPIEAQFHWSDLIINFPAINLRYLIFF